MDVIVNVSPAPLSHTWSLPSVLGIFVPSAFLTLNPHNSDVPVELTCGCVGVPLNLYVPGVNVIGRSLPYK